MDGLGGIRYGAEIAAAAAGHGLDPKLLAAVAAQETGGPGSNSGNNIVGDAGHGHGLFQLDDRSWAFASTPAAMDPAANANAAAGILKDDLDRYGGNVREALSAYNSGSPTATGTTTTWGDGTTLGYADSVMRHYAALGGDPAQLAADARTNQGDVNALAALGGLQPAAAGTIGAQALGTATAAGAAAPAATAGASSSGVSIPPPSLPTPDAQSPFAAPTSWSSITSANGPAGGKQASEADSLVADSIDFADGALDASGDDS
jgi:hypothetical protein